MGVSHSSERSWQRVVLLGHRVEDGSHAHGAACPEATRCQLPLPSPRELDWLGSARSIDAPRSTMWHRAGPGAARSTRVDSLTRIARDRERAGASQIITIEPYSRNGICKFQLRTPYTTFRLERTLWVEGGRNGW